MSQNNKHSDTRIVPFHFFDVKNFEDSKEAFLNDKIRNPVFSYGDIFSSDFLNNYPKHSSQLINTRVDFIKTAHKLQNDHSYLDEYINKNSELYGQPQKDYFDIAAHMLIKPHKLSGDIRLKNKYAKKLYDYTAQYELSYPFDLELHKNLNNYIEKYLGDNPSFNSSQDAFKYVFAKSQLETDGWKLNCNPHAKSASVDHKKKIITYNPNTKNSFKKGHLMIAMHEIYGHAKKKRRPHEPVRESEGWATALEQICEKEPRTKRAIRYLIAGIACGLLDGEKKDFRECYNYAYQAYVLFGKSAEYARDHAYKECVRLFRGGRPDIPGAIFTKDIAYFEGNIMTWKLLREKQPSYEEFIKYLEGKENIYE